MTAHRLMPWAMGALMGLMLPFMLHAGAGLAFVLAHAAVVAPLALLGLALPRLRHALRAHLRPRMLAAMGVAGAAGFAAVCLYCLVIGGAHWPT